MIKTVKLLQIKDLLHQHMNGQTTGITLWDEAWQQQACELLGIQFVHPFQRQNDGSDMILTRPDMRSLRSIGGDKNCFFRALCYITSG